MMPFPRASRGHNCLVNFAARGAKWLRLARRHRALPSLLVLASLNPHAAISRAHDNWVPSWTAAQYRLEPESQLPASLLTDVTLRQAVRLSLGGPQIRLQISNRAGRLPLTIASMHVALSGAPGSAAIDPRSDHEVSFGGKQSVTIAPGETVVSDIVAMPVPDLARMSVSMHFAHLPPEQTGHLRSLSTSWISHGDESQSANLCDAVAIEHWYYLSAIQVEDEHAHAVVTLGDSITDGSLSTLNGNDRWPDILADRIASGRSGKHWAVANEGLAGNRLLADGRGPCALCRFEEDVLSQPHARIVFVLEGINDLGRFAATTQDPEKHRVFGSSIVGALGQLVSKAHARGLSIIGGTIMPDGGSDYHPTSLDNEDRRTINDWIKLPGHFDAVIDWDSALRDPADHDRLNPEFDSGDHIHPSPQGYQIMVDQIPVASLIN